jgi:serine/threonine-protein kinase
MAELVVKYPDRAAEHFQLDRQRITIGRTAKNDLCIPDPFSSRVHTEIRHDGDHYVMQDLGSANGTLYNGLIVTEPVQLTSGGRIQIGETEIIFLDESDANALAGLVREVTGRPLPEGGYSRSVSDQTSAGAMEPIWDPDPSFEDEDEDEDNSHDRPGPGSVRLTPYVPQIEKSDALEQSLKKSHKYEALIPLKPIFRFVHEPIGPKTHSHFIGRQDELRALAERILFSDGGSFLVTGYRGVGKTSFINEVINVLKDNLSWASAHLRNTDVLDIHFNLARPLKPAELMHHIIRGVYQKLMDEGLFSLLDPILQEELALAFQRTSMNMTRNLSDTAESGFGLNEASIGAAYLKASIKAPFSYKKTKTRNQELTFLGYDDKAAEQDIIRISKALAAGYARKQRPFRQLLDRIQRRIAARTALKLVFVFDELDKLEEFSVLQPGRDTHVIDEILSSLKNVFTTSDISFIFVAGKDLQERWQDDLGKGDSIYESIFSFEKYLPCMWSETDQICDRLVDWDRLGGTDNNRDDQLNCIDCGFPVRQEQDTCQRCGASIPNLELARAMLEDFKSYLAYQGRGIPRRIIRGFNEHVLWEKGSPKLGFTYKDIRRIRFYAGLENVLRQSYSTLFSGIPGEIPDAHEDKRRLGVLYVIDWVLRQSIGKFTLSDAANASQLLSTKIALGDEIAINVIKQMFDLLVKNDYLRQVQNPEDQTLAGGANGYSAQYELVPRRLAELGSADIFERDDLALSSEPGVGSRFGQYILTKELAKGGMGQVFEGRDERDGRAVVVKMVASGYGLIKEVNDRLKREAKILAKLKHPNIVKYCDSGEANGRFFLVMEFIDGTDLGIILRSEGKLNLSLVMSIAIPIADALQYVHGRKLVRIDVKPSNIVISKTGQVFLIDFGTAKSKTPESEAITQRGSFVGTPNYMSPEQLKGAPPDERSDIYSFGIVLYESVVGKKPFVRELSDAMDTRIYQPPPSPSEFVTVPDELQALIMRCLEPDPARRFQSMGELTGELNKFTSAIPSTDLAPIAETITHQITQFEQIEGMETSPGIIEPLQYEQAADDQLSEPGVREPILRFLNGPKDIIPNGYPLRDGITIGRSASNDLALDDLKVSRYNTRINQESGAYWIHDLNPAHKTLVNGEPIAGKIKLHDKDVIQIGECVFEFRGVSKVSKRYWRRGSLRKRFRAKQSDVLALISKVGVALLASVTLNETLEQIVSLAFEAVPADRCVIMLRDKKNSEFKVALARFRNRVGEVGEIRISRSLIDEVVNDGKSVLTSDAQADPSFAGGTVMLQGVRTVLAVPLEVGANVFGIVYADSPLADGRFTEDHLKVLTTLASVAAIRVETARLTEEQMERERLEREQKVAGDIQQRFLPASVPVINGYELQGISFPGYEIGGDYYDFIQRDDGKLIVALGDVSGKGTAAALLMSSLHAAVHAQADIHDTLAKTIGAVNRYLVESIPANRFVTLFYAELDPENGALVFLNAGHNPPLIVRADGTMEQLAAGGLPLGIMPNADFREGRTQLHPGDVLVIYSDGVSEAVNPSGEEFGPKRLYEVVARNIDNSAGGIRDRIESSLTKFCQGTPAADDITLVICKRLERD